MSNEKINSCSVDGCNNKPFQRYNGEVWLCAKHTSQMRRCGHILERTVHDKNEIVIDGDIAYIVLYNKTGEEVAKAIIDSKNIDFVKDSKWYLRKDGYVATMNYNGKYTYLHRLICGHMNKRYADHKNRNKLINTEENLREADSSENHMNAGIRKNNTSGKVGVHWAKANNKWCAMICVRKKHINLGYFDNFEDAVKARVDAEKKYFGEYRANNELEIGEI